MGQNAIYYKGKSYTGGGGGSSGGGNLYGTTDPASNLGNNGDIYMKYQGGSEPVESDYKTAWSGTATVTAWANPYTFPFDVTEYHKLRIGNNEKLVSELKTYSYLIDHQAEDEWWIIRDFPAAELCLSDADPTKLQLYGQTGYSYTLSEIQGTTMELHPPQILNVFGKVENEWVKFPNGRYEEVTLWEGSQTITQYNVPFTIPDIGVAELDKYDAFAFDFYNAYSIPRLGIMLTSYIKNHKDINVTLAPNPTDGAYPLFIHYDSTNDVFKAVATTNYGYTLTKVIGIKYGKNDGGGSFEVNYSTEEQKIGTWIDGKPIYQKTFTISGTYQGRASIDVSSVVPNDIELIEATGMMGYSSSGAWSYFKLGNYSIYPYYNANTFKLDIGSATIPVKANVTIKYTKNTD